MNSSPLKVAVVLALLVAVVFAVTYFSQYTPTEPDAPEAGDPGGGTRPPLRFFTTTRQWDPRPLDDSGLKPPSLLDRTFPGFYEADGVRHTTPFWFENTTAQPVNIQLTQVSCNSCSGGDVAPIPPDVTRQLLQMAGASVLPHGLAPGLTVGMAGPAANLAALKWQSYSFAGLDPAQVKYTVPGADDKDGWSPQWGILRLVFEAKPGTQKSLRMEFKSQAQGSDQTAYDRFTINYSTTTPFDVDPPVIDLGGLTDDSPPQTHDLLVLSATRTPDQLPGLTARVLMPLGESGEPGGFVTAGPPTPLAGEELDRLRDLYEKQAPPVRVRSAFRVPVTVRVQDGSARLDIGKVARVVYVTQGAEQRPVTVQGTMRGSVFLSEGKEINLGTFRADVGATETRNVTTAKAGIELGVVKDQTVPNFLQVTLEREPDRDGRGYYKVRVAVPPGKQEGEIRDGVVVLEIKGPHPQRLRIPVKGRGAR